MPHHLLTPFIQVVLIAPPLIMLAMLWLLRRMREKLIATFMAEREIKDRIISDLMRLAAAQHETLLAHGIAIGEPDMPRHIDA